MRSRNISLKTYLGLLFKVLKLGQQLQRPIDGRLRDPVALDTVLQRLGAEVLLVLEDAPQQDLPLPRDLQVLFLEEPTEYLGGLLEMFRGHASESTASRSAATASGRSCDACSGTGG